MAVKAKEDAIDLLSTELKNYFFNTLGHEHFTAVQVKKN